MARDAPLVDAYGQGGFRLSGERHEGSVLILKDKAYAWPVSAMSELTPQAFDPVFGAGREAVEFVLLGAGAANALPPRAVRDALRGAGIGLEVMDTPSAARLYNILTAEGRRIAAALIAV